MIGRNGLDENALDEKALDENWAHEKNFYFVVKKLITKCSNHTID